MAKLNLPDIGSLANSATARQAINDNFTAIEAAVENTISRDGTTPNQMESDLDLNSNSVINVADPVADLDAVNLRSVRPLVDKFAGQIAQVVVEGTNRYEVFTATSGQTQFTLQDSPGSATNMLVFDSGVAMTANVDYQLVGADKKTLEFFVGRVSGNEIVARYVKLSPTDSQLRADLINTTASNYAADLVAYKPTGTNTVDRTVREMIDDGVAVSVLNWIPKAQHAAIRAKTTTFDATTYIQQAINDVGTAGGGTIFFPRGLYNITAKLDIPWSSVVLTGAGSGFYTTDGITLTRNSAATRICWTGTAPAAGTPMVEFRTANTHKKMARGGIRDIMLDGNVLAKVGVAFTSYDHAHLENVHVYAVMEDGFLFRTANYDLASGAVGATQHNVLMHCAVTTYGGSGTYLTNPANGFRFTGAKWGTGGLNATQTGDASSNTLYSPRVDLAAGTMLVFEACGQNTVFKPEGGSWNSSNPDIIFGSTDQDTNWPPSGGITHAKAGVARYNVIYWAEHQIRARASQNTNGVASFGNMVWGLSHGNGGPLPTFENPTNNTFYPELFYQTLGNFTGNASWTRLGGAVEVIAQDNSAAINPALFLKKGSDVGTNGDGLGKIQWRMTNAAGTVDVDAGRFNAVITSATAGAETASISVVPQYNGNGETEAAMGWQNGVIVPAAGGGVNLAYQGFGTVNVNGSYWVDNVKVLGNRATGWAAATGTATRTTFATGSVTTAQLAERVKALIDDLIVHGVIGA